MPNEPTRKQDGDGNNVFFNQIEQNGEYIPFGANDEDIQMHDSAGNKIESLRNFYNKWINFVGYWNNFANNAHFIKMSNSEPQSSNTKIWLQIPNENNSENQSGQ